ncbi:MAG: glycosyltransferase 87 family protein [Candidatus Solibacter sp.]
MLAAAVLFSLTLLTPLDTGMGTGDSSWFLQVSCRLAAGEVLYRDVFFGAGPIGPYLASLFERMSGGEMLGLRLLQLLLFGGIAAVVWNTLRRGGVNSRWQAPVFCALVVYGLEPAFSIYNVLSTLLLLCVMRAALEWHWGGVMRWLWLAGVLAGLEVGAKQNVAVLAALALGVPLLARAEWRGLARAAAGFAGAAGTVSAAVWLSGGWDKFLEYGFTAKGRYLAVGFPPSATVARFLAEMRGAPTWSYQLRLTYSFCALAAAAVCVAAVVAAWLRVRGERGEVNFAASFTAGALLTLYPISDLSHLAYASPIFLIGAVLAVKDAGAPAIWALRAATLWFAPAVVWIALSPAWFAATGQMSMMRVPHFRGVPMRIADRSMVERRVKGLREAVMAGHRPYLITLHAGFYYLGTGLTNLTPFDYPAASAFGKRGEARLIDSLRRREIAEACLDPEFEGIFFAPRELTRFVRTEMHMRKDLGACVLYGW